MSDGITQRHDAKQGNDTKQGNDLADGEALGCDVSDDALEAAAGLGRPSRVQTLESTAANCCH
jgi:hypothetical protein